ncbi:hypothetical protein [Sorangium sp. So ce1389]|uniref:hypothetical protein n=1 Tax=Sorangium sp. So ce1389 TaxID=3133336 RepID=UPI003F6127B2
MDEERIQRNQEQLRVFGEHLKRLKIPIPTCQICGRKEWDFSGVWAMFEIHEPKSPGLPAEIGKLAVSIAVLTCRYCSHTIHFNWERITKGGENA